MTKKSIDTEQLEYSFKCIIGNLIVAIYVLITILILGVCYEYRITLITIIFSPILIVLTIIRRFTVQVCSSKSLADGEEEGGKILSECTNGLKTIFSNNFNQEALCSYLEAIDYIIQRRYLNNFINSISLNLIIFFNYMFNVINFALGIKYIVDNSLNSDEMTVI